MTGPDGLSPEVGRVVGYASDLALVAGDLSLGPEIMGIEIVMLREAAEQAARAAELLTAAAQSATRQLAVGSEHLDLEKLPGKEFGARFADPHWRPRDIVPKDIGGLRTICIEGDHELSGPEGEMARFDPERPDDVVMVDMFNVLAALRAKGIYGHEMQTRAQYWPVKPKALGPLRDRLTARLARIAGGGLLEVVRIGQGGQQRWILDSNLRIDDNRFAV